MVGKVTPMDAKLVAVAAALERVHGGERVNVRALSAQLGMSAKTFYKWAQRYRDQGLAGLEEQSRRPRRSPHRLSPMIEDAVIELRKRLSDEGLDAGPATIRWHLGREGRLRPPSEATIWRVLRRRGFIVDEPRKRPLRSRRRFEAPVPNQLWQIDATEWTLAQGAKVDILNVIDDHSRLCVASRAAPTATTQRAWTVFAQAADRYGLPGGCLSDNGLAFSGRLRGFEVFFETQLRAAGVRPITSKPFHPQTCGKVERFQQTLKKWLAARRHPAGTLDDLNAQLEQFRRYYNHQRPHRGIGRQTPWQRWNSADKAGPGGAIPLQQHHQATITANGVAPAGHWLIHVGNTHAGRPADIVIRDHHASVFIHGRLVRDFDLDPTRRYQPSRHR
jgi:transposase InsO family protein